MTSAISSFPASSVRGLSHDDCIETIGRTCFGHLSFLRDGHVDVLATRYAYLDNWLYFRADAALADLIRQNQWMVMTVSEMRDVTEFASVVVRGSCYPAEDTGSPQVDESALAGIKALRDRPRIGREDDPRVSRSLRVFRMHIDEINGGLISVPCPADARPYDPVELRRLRAMNMQQTSAEDARGDDDGMPEPAPAVPPRSRG